MSKARFITNTWGESNIDVLTKHSSKDRAEKWLNECTRFRDVEISRYVLNVLDVLDIRYAGTVR